MYCAKTELIKVPLWGLTHVGQRNYVLDEGSRSDTSICSARGGKSAMQPFTKVLWTHVYTVAIKTI